MLLKRSTFSLMYLVMLVALGLVVVSPTHADTKVHELKAEFKSVDRSTDAGHQPQLKLYNFQVNWRASGYEILLPITFSKEVEFHNDVTDEDVNAATDIPGNTVADTFSSKDIKVFAFDPDGVPYYPGEYEQQAPERFVGGLPEDLLVTHAQHHVIIADPSYADVNGYEVLNPFGNPINSMSIDMIEDDYQPEDGALIKEALIVIRDISWNDDFSPRGPSGLVETPGSTFVVQLPAGSVKNANAADRIDAAISRGDGDHTLGKNNYISIKLTVSGYDEGAPEVRAIRQFSDIDDIDFALPGVRGPFDVTVLLSEKPKEFGTQHIQVANGTATDIEPGVPMSRIDAATAIMTPQEFNHIDDDDDGIIEIRDDRIRSQEFPYTGGDELMYPYRVTITPNLTSNADVVISVKEFEDTVLPTPYKHIPDPIDDLDADITDNDKVELRSHPNGSLVDNYIYGNQKLVVAVDPTAVTPPADIYKPSNDHFNANNQHLKRLDEKLVVPANGYLVLVNGNEAQSGIVNSPVKPADKKTAAQKLYNIKYGFALPYPADDLSNFFRNGGVLQLLHVDIPGNTTGADGDKGYPGASSGAAVPGSLIINEIMWAIDNGDGVSNVRHSQYIEIHNTTDAAIGLDKNEWVIAVGAATDTFYTTVVDIAGNNGSDSGYWKAPGTPEGVTAPSALYPTLADLVSMSRVTGATDGTAAASWAESMRPSANLNGRRVGTPGAANLYVTAPVAPTPEPTPEPTTPVAMSGDLMISEIMVSSNDGRLPQWIEITNVSDAAVSLSGWSLRINNDPADAGAAAPSLLLPLGDVEIGAGQVALVISKTGRNSGVGDAPGDIRADRIIDVQSMASPNNARYMLLSEMGFLLTLVPPQTGVVQDTSGDTAGNLGSGWALSMAEGNRSSLIRREKGGSGTDAAGWVLASSTGLKGNYRETYYGHDNDAGTPGYNAGGALPVELSLFTAARDRLTGAVVINWETQSELNNAGFYIKRSESRKGTFAVVNPTLIAGAGTTSEKQSYTYTDTSAKPNVVYYYQIEDVSLDGTRQTLTRSHRLKGHIGAAGKVTTTWGDLKGQE